MLLSVRDLRVGFPFEQGEAWAVDGVSFDIAEGETVGLVGESGCGKSTVARSVLDLVPEPGRVAGGRILFEGRDVLTLEPRELRDVRGGRIGLVFQDPSASLNPVLRVGDQIAEVARLHLGLDRAASRAEAVRLLGDVGMPDPEKWTRAFPFELSGGMRQRAALALGISGRPRLLIADEPTAALDVTVQAVIADLFGEIQERRGMSLLFVSHDLALVAERADRIMVMYAGRIVEIGRATSVVSEPCHPYTRALLRAMPVLGAEEPLEAIPGSVPGPLDRPPGCSFHPRCALGDQECTAERPALRTVGDRLCACIKVES
jgi:oligopeptide/dipeptide ABC transporter ATP-binding protein